MGGGRRSFKLQNSNSKLMSAGVGSCLPAAPNFVPLPCEVVANGVKDACELAHYLPHVPRVPHRARGWGLASSVTTKQPLWPQEAIILNEPGRRMARWGRREAAGSPSTGGPAERVPVMGRL